MLPPAALDIADRLITALMTLVRAVAPVALARGTPTFDEFAAHTLFLRLSGLITRLIRISNFGVPARAAPAPTEPSAPGAPPLPPAPRDAAMRLPSRPGWLLDALPEIAPAVAADLRALLDDPAIATLLGAAPTLHRSLRPLLRGLGLAAAPPNPPSQPTPPSTPPPERESHAPPLNTLPRPAEPDTPSLRRPAENPPPGIGVFLRPNRYVTATK